MNLHCHIFFKTSEFSADLSSTTYQFWLSEGACCHFVLLFNFFFFFLTFSSSWLLISSSISTTKSGSFLTDSFHPWFVSPRNEFCWCMQSWGQFSRCWDAFVSLQILSAVWPVPYLSLLPSSQHFPFGITSWSWQE